jgi:hypothetical protein
VREIFTPAKLAVTVTALTNEPDDRGAKLTVNVQL